MSNQSPIKFADFLRDSSLVLPIDLYSMNFTSAERILVKHIDYTTEERTRRVYELSKANIPEIINLLSLLPKKGEWYKSFIPTHVYHVIAFKNDLPFAYVELYEDSLKTESTSFYDSNDAEVRDMEVKLYNLVTN